MFRASALALLSCLLVLSIGSFDLDAKQKEDPKKDEKKTDSKKEDPPAKLKGTLPPNWKKLGLTDTQVQEIYRIQSKHNEEIAKLEAKIKEHKAAREKEERAVLTPEQKKRLEEILIGKDKDK